MNTTATSVYTPLQLHGVAVPYKTFETHLNIQTMKSRFRVSRIVKWHWVYMYVTEHPRLSIAPGQGAVVSIAVEHDRVRPRNALLCQKEMVYARGKDR